MRTARSGSRSTMPTRSFHQTASGARPTAAASVDAVPIEVVTIGGFVRTANGPGAGDRTESVWLLCGAAVNNTALSLSPGCTDNFAGITACGFISMDGGNSRIDSIVPTAVDDRLGCTAGATLLGLLAPIT